MNNKNSIKDLGVRAKKAAGLLASVSNDQKNEALNNLKNNLEIYTDELVVTNKKDIDNAHAMKLSVSMIDRLTLNQDRIRGMMKSLDDIVDLQDPVGKTLSEWNRPNGLHIKKISVPLGVIGIIYESRPNVTVDASAIAVKAGNAVLLRGGKDSFHSSQKLNEIINKSFATAGLPDNTVQMVATPDRQAVDEMLGLDSYIDVIIPRGGKGLIKNVKEKSSIPVIKHSDGICHIYVDKDADLNIATNVIFNSKMRRPGICGAAETLLIDKTLSENTPSLLQNLIEAGCEIRGDVFVKSLNANFKNASEEDWGTEYLDKIISVKIVGGLQEAIHHINHYSSGHTEAIITQNSKTFQTFHHQINSAIILQNASTQYADGGEFGFGAEIGISTDKLHVRGPVGAEHLTSFKYVIHGNGQVRP
jgi:glutamate-5-semialdehyde dehydrogenase